MLVLISGTITPFTISNSYGQENIIRELRNEVIPEIGVKVTLENNANYFFTEFDFENFNDDQIIEAIHELIIFECDWPKIVKEYGYTCEDLKITDSDIIETDGEKFFLVTFNYNLKYTERKSFKDTPNPYAKKNYDGWMLIPKPQKITPVFYDGMLWNALAVSMEKGQNVQWVDPRTDFTQIRNYVTIVSQGTEWFVSEMKDYPLSDPKIIVDSFELILKEKIFLKKMIPVNIFIFGHDLSSAELLKLKTRLISTNSPILWANMRDSGIQYQYNYNIVSIIDERNEKMQELMLSESEESDLLDRVLSKVSPDHSWVNEFHPDWIIEKNNWPNPNPILEVEHEYRIVDVKAVEDFLFTNLVKDKHENEINLIFLDYDLEELNFLRNFKVSSIDQSSGEKFEAIGMMGYGGENNLYFIDLYSTPWKQYDYNENFEIEYFWSDNFKTLHDCSDCLEQVISDYSNEFLNGLVNPYFLYDPGVYSKINIELLLYQRSGVNSITPNNLPKFINEDLIKSELSQLYPYADWEISITLADKKSRDLDKRFIDELERPNLFRDNEGKILEGAESYQYISSETFRPIMKYWANEVNSQSQFEDTTKTIPILLVAYDGNRLLIDGRAEGIAFPDEQNPLESCCVFAVKNVDEFWGKKIGATDLIIHEMGHVMGLNHPFSSFDKDKQHKENNFFNFYSSPMTYATPGYQTACAGYFNNIWTEQEVRSQQGYGFEIQLVNVDLLEEECGITDTKFTEFEKNRIYDAMVTAQLQRGNFNVQWYKASASEIDQVRVLEIQTLITLASKEFLKNNPDKQSVLMKAVEANKKSEVLINSLNPDVEDIISDESGYQKIPDWVKNNAKWWSEGTIQDNDFVGGIQFLIKEGIIKIPKSGSKNTSETNEIPDWVKNNAKWWSEELISDADFIKGIQHLVNQGILKVR